VISFKHNSAVLFANNSAQYGDDGAVSSTQDCTVSFNDNSVVIFANNTADEGGTVYSNGNCSISLRTIM